MATVLIDEQCEIPAGIGTLSDFRRWAVSPEFPPTGRIDWVASRIEVDMSPEDIFTHGTLKSEIVRSLANLAKDRGMHLCTGETRVSNPSADLSCPRPYRRRPAPLRPLWLRLHAHSIPQPARPAGV